MDLRKIVSIYVIHSGNNPNYEDCVKALENQGAIFDVQEIENIAPMSKAFQLMLDLCRTMYFIQVDSDMVLNPNAVITMYHQIARSGNAMECYALIDSHLDFPIQGVKIYDARVFSQFPYNQSHPSCEVEQLDRVVAAGYKWQAHGEVMGYHSPKWTDEGIFERYYNLAQKYRLYGYNWMGPELEKKLEAIFLKDPSSVNWFACAGYIEGKIGDLIETEKDYRKHLPAFLKIMQSLHE